MNIDLNWTELKPIDKIIFKEEYGIYIWGFMFDKEFVPYYVGIAYNTTIPQRLTEHANQIIGGRYCVIHSADLKTFYNFKHDEETSDERGKMYIPNWPDGYSKFLTKRNIFKPHIDNMINKMHYSYALINDESISKKEYELIEKKCISSIGIEKLINFRGGKADVVTINKLTGDKRITDLFVNK